MLQHQSTSPQFENQVAQVGAALRRRRWPLLGVLALGVVTTLLVALLWPATYRSTATIYVEPPDVTAETPDMEDLPSRQIARVTQRVMTTENLAPLLRETGLYADQDLSVIERVDLMRQHYVLEEFTAQSVDARGRPSESVVTFDLSFLDADPAMAQRVVNRLVTLYLRENSEIRKSRFAERARFLGNEAEQIAEEIQRLEEEKARFQVANEDALPGSYQANLQLLQRAESARLETDRRLAAVEDRLIYLRAELATVADGLGGGSLPLTPRQQLARAEADLRVLQTRYGGSHPDVVAKRRQVQALEVAIEEGRLASETPALAAARAELAVARERYTESHPEVVRLTQRVAELETAAESAEAPRSEAEVRLRADLASAQAEARSLVALREEQTRQVAGLQAAISRLPQVELNYNAITRDLENLREQYLSIKAQELDARVALEVETQRRGQRFVIIEDPSLPTEPSSPNRTAIVFLGCVLSLFLAALVVAGLETADTAVYGRTALVDLFGTAPLAVIPTIGPPPGEAQAARGRLLLWGGAGLALVTAVALVLVHALVIELPVLFDQLFQGIG